MHPELPKHVTLTLFAQSYVTRITCAHCTRSVEVPCLVPAWDDEYWPLRDKFVTKHARCKLKVRR